MKINVLFLSITLLLFALLHSLFAVSGPDLRGNITSLADEFAGRNIQPNEPGFVIAVVSHGKMLAEKAYGCADAEKKIPNSPGTLFEVGSVTKQFTAALVAALMAKGKISVDDDIRKYFPDFPDYGDTITVGNLLHHTSGIRDVLNLMMLAGWPIDRDYTDEKMMALLERQKGLNFPAGDAYGYSNSNYFLLGKIVQKITGKTLNACAREILFDPAGMHSTVWREQPDQKIKNRARGYLKKEDGTFHGDFDLIPANKGETGINTTAGDLMKWDQNFYSPRFALPEIIDMMQERGVLNNGDTIRYAFGLEIGSYKGYKTVSHDGGTGTFFATIKRFPEQKFTIIFLANRSDLNAGGLFNAIADMMLGLPAETKSTAPAGSQANAENDKTLYDQYAGDYSMPNGFTISITREGDKLEAQGTGQPRFEITPESDSTFFLEIANAHLTFRKDNEGKVDTLILNQGGQTIPFSRRIQEPLTPAEKEQMAGEYYCDELDVVYKIALRNDELVLEAPELPAIISERSSGLLKRIKGYQFSESMHTLEFLPDESGNISAFTLSIPRAAGLHFEKVLKGE